MSKETAVTQPGMVLSKPRIIWLDNAKALGIILVFYGHLLELLYLNLTPLVFEQFKFIYAFHMPLFFILAGYVSKNRLGPFPQYLKVRLAIRVLPFLVFNILGLFCLIFIDIGQGTLNLDYYGRGMLALLRGFPSFNTLTWFLVCLFTVEMIHFGLHRFLISRRRLLFTAVIFLTVGLIITRNPGTTSGRLFPLNFWYLHEALIAYAFYLFGVWGRGQKVSDSLKSWQLVVAGCIFFFLLTGLTYRWNTGPFKVDVSVVIMSISSHGNWFWFPVTAVLGSLFIFYFSYLLPTNHLLLYLGQNTLILLGLNGLFFEFFNARIIAYLAGWWHESIGILSLQVGLITAVSLLICTIFIHFFNKYLPQLFGHPRQAGPILPKFF